MTKFDWSNHLMPEESETKYPPAFRFDTSPEQHWTQDDQGRDVLCGKTLDGTVTAIREWNKNGDKIPIVEVETPNGPVSLFVSQTKLKQLVGAQNPQVNDGITIEYLGKVDTKNGRQMNDYSVEVKWAQNADGAEPF